MDIILKVLKYVLQSRSYMYVAARGAPFTRAHLYTNVLFFFYVIIFLFVLSLFVILMLNRYPHPTLIIIDFGIISTYETVRLRRKSSKKSTIITYLKAAAGVQHEMATAPEPPVPPLPP